MQFRSLNRVTMYGSWYAYTVLIDPKNFMYASLVLTMSGDIAVQHLVMGEVG